MPFRFKRDGSDGAVNPPFVLLAKAESSDACACVRAASPSQADEGCCRTASDDCSHVDDAS
eukprot:9226676-Lingulodinium_polyedra.AAC.1